MILKFWLEEIDPSLWWSKNDELDQRIRERFAEIHTKAIRCELYYWRKVAEERLAETIVLDQFSRNMFRAPIQKALPFPKSNMFRLGLATYEKTD